MALLVIQCGAALGIIPEKKSALYFQKKEDPYNSYIIS